MTGRQLRRRLFLSSAAAAVVAGVMSSPVVIDQVGYTAAGGKRKPRTGFGVVPFGTSPFGK